MENRIDLVLTNFVRAEAYSLILGRLGRHDAQRWLHGNDIPVVLVTPQDEDAALTILREYSDKDFSLVDATSFAVMKRLDLARAFAFDRHFLQFGFQFLTA